MADTTVLSTLPSPPKCTLHDGIIDEKEPSSNGNSRLAEDTFYLEGICM